jgi:hypothetical protein
VCESAGGCGDVEATALESETGDGHWLSSVHVSEGWVDGQDDGTVVEIVGLEDCIVDAALVRALPPDNENWVEQPSVHRSDCGDDVSGDGSGGAGSRAEDDLDVRELLLEQNIIEEVTSDGDSISGPSKGWLRGNNDWTVSERRAGDHLRGLVPPHGDGLVGQASTSADVANHNAGVGWGGDGHLCSVEINNRSGDVEEDVIRKTNTREGHGECTRVQITTRWVDVGAKRSIMVSGTPDLVVEANVWCGGSDGGVGKQLNVNENVGVEVTSSDWGLANDWVVSGDWSGHEGTDIVAKEADGVLPATQTETTDGDGLSTRSPTNSWDDTGDDWSVEDVVG